MQLNADLIEIQKGKKNADPDQQYQFKRTYVLAESTSEDEESGDPAEKDTYILHKLTSQPPHNEKIREWVNEQAS